jgi:protocatechuate 3,4-dioxygenase beta subunit
MTLDAFKVILNASQTISDAVKIVLNASKVIPHAVETIRNAAKSILHASKMDFTACKVILTAFKSILTAFKVTLHASKVISHACKVNLNACEIVLLAFDAILGAFRGTRSANGSSKIPGNQEVSMRRSRRLLCSAVVALLGCLPLASTEIPIDGRVRDSGGVGLAGIRVELRPILSSYEQGLRELAGQAVEPAARTVTGSDGRFELLAPGEGMWEVGVFGEGFVPRRFRLTPLTGAETLPPVTLKRDAGLRVRVEGPDGRPLAGARVVGRIPGGEEPDRIATSGADGVARLACSRDEMMVLFATAPGFPVQEGPEGRGPTEVTFRLAAGTPQRVNAPEGAILRDLQTSLVLSEVVTTGESWLLLETAEGVRVRFAVPAKKDLEVPAAAPLPGRVIDSAARLPVAGAWVWPADDPGRFVRTDEQGGYRMQPSSSLRIAAAGHLSEILDESTPRPPGALPPTALDPKAEEGRPEAKAVRGRMLTGRIEDRQGRPAADAEVVIEEGETVAITGPDGRFAFAEAPYGWNDMVVRQPGAVPQRLPRFEVGQGDGALDLGSLRLDEEEVLTARIVDPEGRPVARAEVWAGLWERPGKVPAAVTGPDGIFMLRASRWQPLHLTVCGPGFVPLGLFLPQFFPEETLLVTARPGAAITGRITGGKRGADGLPVARSYADLDLFGDSDRYPFHDCAGGGSSMTDEAGRFRVTGLEPGLYSVAYRERMTLAAGESREIAIHEEEREMGAALSGRLLDAEGQPVPGAMVSLRSRENLMAAASRTDADGNYRLTFEKPGMKVDESSLGVIRHDKTLVMSGWSSWEGPEVLEREGRYDITLKEDDPGPRFELAPAKVQPIEPVSTLAGRILGLAAEELARVKVMARLSFDYSYWTVGSVDPQGNYHLEGLSRDGWWIRAEAADRTLFEAVHIPEGEARITRDLVFEPVAEVSGRIVTSEDEPVADAAVSFRHEAVELQTRRPIAGARTRSDGYFSIRLPEGEYEVRASKDGFVPWSEMPWDAVSVEDGKGDDAYLTLLPAAVLRGRLLGLPADQDDVKIEATLVDGEPGYRKPLPGKMTAEGRYEIPGLGPGTWKVEAVYEILGGKAEPKAAGRVVIPEGAREATLDLAFR